MDFATNSIGIVSLSPEQAAEYARHNYDHNRGLRQNHVEYLANEMRNGRFMPTAEVHVMYRNGEPVLVNGQHTCAAIVKYGKPVRVTLRKTIANEVGQIAMMYAFGHDTGLGRTFNDSMRAYDVAESTSATSTQVNNLASAIRFIRGGFISSSGASSARISPADLIEDVYAWMPEVKLLSAITANTDKKIARIMRKRSVLSIAILTLHYQQESAMSFWRGIVDPDRLPSRDIRVKARTILLDSVSRRTDAQETNKLARQMARSWNSFFKGDGIVQVKVLDTNSPMVLLGTPYNGRQPFDFLSSKPETMRVAA